MRGNGIDVYDLIPGLDETSWPSLYLTDKNFLVGVIEGMSPSPPVPRHKTKCFIQAPVYLYNMREVFAMTTDYKTGKKEFYIIPPEERRFIESI